jgi:predicted amidohydrolase YtcJ
MYFSPPYAEILIKNGTIYSLKNEKESFQAMAVAKGKIVFLGDEKGAQAYVSENTKVIDAKGKFVFPGLIETHAHFLGIGHRVRMIDATSMATEDELIDAIKAKAQITPVGDWIVVRGWHQDRIQHRGPMVEFMPTNTFLNKATQHHPVFIYHNSFHMILVNELAIKAAGLNVANFKEHPEVIISQNKFTGIFKEKSIKLISAHLPMNDVNYQRESLQAAMDEVLQNGFTSIHAASVGAIELQLLEEFHQKQQLKVRVNVMLDARDEQLLESWLSKGPFKAEDGHLTVNYIKVFMDGALGSGTAWMLAPFTDDHTNSGLALQESGYLKNLTLKAIAKGFQMCTHAIGDKANQVVLNEYAEAMQLAGKGVGRHRIEHAQHIDPDDFKRFDTLNVIPAMQPVHYVSDHTWAITKIGKERMKNAYSWKTFLDHEVPVIAGSDAPIEELNPFISLQIMQEREGQQISAYEALKTFTVNAAYATFDEKIKGTLELGKFADFIIVDQDLLKINSSDLSKTRVLKTFTNGEEVFTIKEKSSPD